MTASDGRPPAPETALPLGMTDLEELLRAAGGRDRATELIARFGALDEQLKQSIELGLPPDSYAKAVEIRNALAAARDLLLRFPAG